MNTQNYLTCCLLISAVIFSGCFGTKESTITDATDEKFSPGQVWKYKTRKGEEESRVTILKIDNATDYGTIVHVQVSDLVMVDDQTQKKIFYPLSFLPMSRGALNKSVTELESSDAKLLDFNDRYQNWKKVANAGTVTILMKTIPELIVGSEEGHKRLEAERLAAVQRQNALAEENDRKDDEERKKKEEEQKKAEQKKKDAEAKKNNAAKKTEPSPSKPSPSKPEPSKDKEPAKKKES